MSRLTTTTSAARSATTNRVRATGSFTTERIRPRKVRAAGRRAL
jgi:hypothetical protein